MKRSILPLDLSMFPLYRLYLERAKDHVLIIDRYFYDSLADVANGRGWQYIRLAVNLAPTPDVPVFVDVSPEQAFSRKGETSVNYMEERRANYQKIFGWVQRPVVLVNEDLEATIHTLENIVTERMAEIAP